MHDIIAFAVQRRLNNNVFVSPWVYSSDHKMLGNYWDPKRQHHSRDYQKPSPGLLWNSHAKPRNNTTFIWMEIRYERLKSDLKMWTKCKTFISFLYCIVCSLLFFNIKTHHQKKALRLMFRKHYSIRSCKRTTTHVLRI